MSFKVVEGVLAGDVADAGTFTVSYPSGTDASSYARGVNPKITLPGLGSFSLKAGTMSVSYGASNITVTNSSGATWPQSKAYYLQLDQAGDDDGVITLASPTKMRVSNLINISLGAPDVADADGVCASQAGTAATAMTINGALASSGVATFDVPRNVVAAWTNTATLTVTGTDEYGNTVVETSASGTSMAGKKAFKTITSVVPSANITGATVGTGDVLGLPVFIPGLGSLLKEIQDGAVASAGTLVAGATATPTATTGDVRGTYDPSAAADGAKVFELVFALDDPSYTGRAQYAG